MPDQQLTVWHELPDKRKGLEWEDNIEVDFKKRVYDSMD